MTTPTQPPDLTTLVPAVKPPHARPSLPETFTHTTPPPILITQGAEALLYRTSYLHSTQPSALKHRPSKPYRHPLLDARLTRHRILSEARVLVKCRRQGVVVPAVYAVDWEQGWLMMEWIEGGTVRGVLDEWLHHVGVVDDDVDVGARGGDDVDIGHGREKNKDGEEELRGLMERVGKAVGTMHCAGVVHGDLTTSNLMLRPFAMFGAGGRGGSSMRGDNVESGRGLEGEVVLIDFGLAAQSIQDEDRAVDLYVLERAFRSTHPRAEGLFMEVLRAYGKSYAAAGVVLRKLEEVRMRGRKRSMIG